MDIGKKDTAKARTPESAGLQKETLETLAAEKT
jgi:hypothetical protein